MRNIKNIIEAALFVAAKPLSLAEIYAVVKNKRQLTKKQIETLLKDMEKEYNDHGIKVIEKKEGIYELKVKDEYLNHVEYLAPERDMTRAVIQTLSLIAFKNPVKQSIVIDLRGNRAYDHIKELESKGFIRTEPSGHTNMISITRKFLDYFGLTSQSQVKDYFIDKGVTEESFIDDEDDGDQTEEKEFQKIAKNPKERVLKQPVEDEPKDDVEKTADKTIVETPKDTTIKKEKTEAKLIEPKKKIKTKESTEKSNFDKNKTENKKEIISESKSDKEEPKKDKDEYKSPFADVI